MPINPNPDMTKPNYRKAGVALKPDSKKTEQYVRAKQLREDRERKNDDLKRLREKADELARKKA